MDRRGPPGGLRASRARPRADPGEGLRGGAAALGERGRPGSALNAAERAVALRRRRPRPAGVEEGPEIGAARGSCPGDDCRQRGALRSPSRRPPASRPRERPSSSLSQPRWALGTWALAAAGPASRAARRPRWPRRLVTAPLPSRAVPTPGPREGR